MTSAPPDSAAPMAVPVWMLGGGQACSPSPSSCSESEMGEFNRSSSDNDNSPAQEGGSIRSECHQPDEYPLYEGSPFSTTQGCLVLVMILQVSANSTVFRSDTVEFLCTLTILKHTSG